MKTVHPHSLLQILGICGLFILNGCQKNSTESPKTQAPPPEPKKVTALASAEKNSFQEVTSRLDAGGSAYVYLSTEQWMEGISTKISNARGVLNSIPNLGQPERENLDKAFELVTHLVKDSGAEDISGFGMSSIALEKELYRGKVLLHHYPGKGTGFLWTLFGQKPHALTGLDMLPAQTALATFSDLDFAAVWNTVQKEVGQANFPQAEELLKQLPSHFEQATGLSWDKVIASLGGEFGFVLTLDETHKISVPLPTPEPLDIPEPGLLIVGKVKDDTIFNRIDEALEQTGQQIISVDKPDLKMRTLPVPLPLPMQLRPSVATSQGYLFIATTDGLIQQVLDIKAGKKPGLKSTPEFQRLLKEIPTEGNSFSFMSKRLGSTIAQIQKQALAMRGGDANSEWVQSLLGTNAGLSSYSVSANTSEGWYVVANATQNPAKVMLAPTLAVPVAIGAAVALPALAKAKAEAQGNAAATNPSADKCIANLNQIAAAKQKWALEKNKTESDTPMRSELLPYLRNQQFPNCPAGGTYNMNAIGTPPECSVPGHQIPGTDK